MADVAVHGPCGQDQTGIKMLPQKPPWRDGHAPGLDGKNASIGWGTSQEPGASPCTPNPPNLKSSPGEGGEGENPELPAFNLKFLSFTMKWQNYSLLPSDGMEARKKLNLKKDFKRLHVFVVHPRVRWNHSADSSEAGSEWQVLGSTHR